MISIRANIAYGLALLIMALLLAFAGALDPIEDEPRWRIVNCGDADEIVWCNRYGPVE